MEGGPRNVGCGGGRWRVVDGKSSETLSLSLDIRYHVPTTHLPHPLHTRAFWLKGGASCSGTKPEWVQDSQFMLFVNPTHATHVHGARASGLQPLGIHARSTLVQYDINKVRILVSARSCGVTGMAWPSNRKLVGSKPVRSPFSFFCFCFWG